MGNYSGEKGHGPFASESRCPAAFDKTKDRVWEQPGSLGVLVEAAVHVPNNALIRKAARAGSGRPHGEYSQLLKVRGAVREP